MNALFKVATRQDPWEGFTGDAWRNRVDVRAFI